MTGYGYVFMKRTFPQDDAQVGPNTRKRNSLLVHGFWELRVWDLSLGIES